VKSDALRIALGAALLLAACAPASPPPERDCTLTIWARSAHQIPSVTASFDHWAEPGMAMSPYGRDDWYSLTVSLPAGEYGYLVTDDAGTHPDAYNPQRTYRGDEEVSLGLVGDCSRPEAKIDAVETTDDGTITVRGTFFQASAASGGPETGFASVRAESPGGALDAIEMAPDSGRFTLRGSGFPRGKHTFTVLAEDASGAVAEAPLAVAWVKPAAPQWNQGLLYQVIVDRFRADGGGPLSPPATPGHRAGGTLDGVRAAVESGYFDDLGVSALWLSPVYENPTGLLEGRDGHMYEGYHGYWPLASRQVEPKIGGEPALRALIAAAHARGMAVLFDFVPNHVHEANERYLQHAGDGWFNNGPEACVCGTSGCPWDETCWFADYLPDVRWQSSDAMKATLEDLRFWTETFDADGVRIDAVPLMPRLATRRMALSLRTSHAPQEALFSIGEVYTGPGAGGTDSIRYFLGPDGLHGAFDFPLAWALRSAIAHDNGDFGDVEATLAYTETSLQGSGAVLGRMVDNHDMQRFLTEASGQAAADAWENPAPQPTETAPYDKLRVALALVLTLPGLPVLYYGDEVGLAGGSDPDNRRVLPADAALSLSQQHVLETTRRLGQLRACSAALRSGDRKAFLATKTSYGFTRAAASDAAVVLLSTASEAAQIVPPLEAVPPGTYVDAFTAEPFEIGGGAPIPVAPTSFRILLPENSPCLSASTRSH
jgi:glycosidase